jgi:UDP-3-O-[3-hydroxymyristoyl] glucosamine N-acyltransferase
MKRIRKLLMMLGYKLKYLGYSDEDYARAIGVKIGKNCIISTRLWGREPYLIEIGNHVRVTSGVSFIIHDGGVWVFREEIPSIDVFGKIKVEDNTYIGNNVVILPGVKIGKNCVIGASSVVTKSIPDNTVAAGNPARFICNTDEYKKKMIPLNLDTKLMSEEEKRKKIMALPNHKQIKKEWMKRIV